ncbi:MAG: cobalamin synthesis protein P47K [Deltaproteobacteria bacterium]|jgi:G3E family GTPase|nr:cobalamin synthesis protein P47K [Deltaproteobacteria bacterium]
MNPVKVIIVGGFLGAGKTTLLAKARKELTQRGLKTGLVTNDQATALADTIWLGGGEGLEEFTGSCYCCNFNGFAKALEALTDWGAQIIVAEPVGSCADLSATVLQPMKDLLKAKFSPTPFSVLLDPQRAKEVLGTKIPVIHKDASYIVEKQLQEADLILLNKIDRLSESEAKDLADNLAKAYPQAKVSLISAREGLGVSQWLDEILKLDSKAAGNHLLEIDYDRYANGEAALGWLNLSADIDYSNPDGEELLAYFMEKLRKAFEKKKIEAGHIKVLWPSPKGLFIGNIVDVREKALITKSECESQRGPILVNARVECGPDALEELIKKCLEELDNEKKLGLKIKNLYALIPGRPNPTYRYDKVVA